MKQQDIKKSLGDDNHEISNEFVRLLREIRSYEIRHPNIVEIRESFLTPDGQFITVSEIALTNLLRFRQEHTNITAE